MEREAVNRRLRAMRPRVLLLVPLVGALLGTLVGAAMVRGRPPCFETALCRVKVGSSPSGCLPEPCDGSQGVPPEVWVSLTIGVLVGLAVAVALELRQGHARPDPG